MQVGQQRVHDGGTGGPVDAALGQLLDGVVQRRPAVRVLRLGVLRQQEQLPAPARAVIAAVPPAVLGLHQWVIRTLVRACSQDALLLSV